MQAPFWHRPALRLLYAGIFSLLTACESPFSVHPYDVHLKGNAGINAKNITRIEQACRNKDTLRVAFISDTHSWRAETKAEVAHINSRSDLDFVVHCGDLTDLGGTKEFEWARDILEGLRLPYVVMIGNHDFLGTGDQVYHYLYGEKDFSFIAGGVKFLCINTNATEYDYMAAVPNLDFLEVEKDKEREHFDRTVAVMHAPPYSDQFNNNVAKAFRHYIGLFPNLLFCAYGHHHTDNIITPYNDALQFYGINSAANRTYRVFTITPQGYEEELVHY